MRDSAHKLRLKAEKLMRLYSLWQETRRRDLKRQCLGLLNEILTVEPNFSLRHEFEMAF